MSNFCHWGNFNWGGGGFLLPPPLATPMLQLRKNKKSVCKCSAKLLIFFNKILRVQKIVLSSSQGQGNFRGPKASRPRPRQKTWPSRPRPRTSKCVLEDSTSVSNHFILSISHELLIFASFLLLYSRQFFKKNNNSKTWRFENYAMQNLHEIML